MLLRLGARVPQVSKWAPYYYFKHERTAALLLERGMDPNHMNWHRFTLLHHGRCWQRYWQRNRRLTFHPMRGLTDRDKLERFMAAIGSQVRGAGRIYLTGGATALLHGWRASTIDVDISADPEPPGLFEAIARLKEELDINVELASPADFIPPLPGWQERSIPIAQHGDVAFLHYDPYAQVLSKLQRAHERDLRDAEGFWRAGLIDPRRLRELFEAIESRLIRYPAIDAVTFSDRVLEFCRVIEGRLG